MKAKVIEDADEVTYVVVCDPGDEAFDVLTQFARAQDLEASQITAVGAFSRATVGWFDRATKQYRRIPVDEQCEVLSLIGDVAEGQDGPACTYTSCSACRTGQRAEVTSWRDGCSRRWRSSSARPLRSCAR